MQWHDLREEVAIQVDAIELTLQEIASLHLDVAGREPTQREVAAAGLFLANFYNGIENILKRLCRFYSVALPLGDNWHIQLVQAFCQPPQSGLPVLLDDALAQSLAPYRRFRHVVYHGYGVQFRWHDLLPGIKQAAHVWSSFHLAVETHLIEIDPTSE